MGHRAASRTKRRRTERETHLSPLNLFLTTEKTGSQSNSDEAALRGTVNVWQGCAWRVRYKRCPTCALEILMIASLWELFDLEGKLKNP